MWWGPGSGAGGRAGAGRPRGPCLPVRGGPLPGGRARALPDGSDNGTHALLAGNRAALAFLGRIGAREGWLEPEPEGLPLLDLASGRRGGWRCRQRGGCAAVRRWG